ncbi:MAG: hypothetical protein M9958_10860 [Chitinophagales bacterium]|nr:hypothetical protein [Chitinophagales bacterium]
MKPSLLTVFLFITLFFHSCKESNNLPSNNDFSYLDSTKSHLSGDSSAVINEEPSEDYSQYSCPPIKKELIGQVYQKGVATSNSTELKSYNVLRLNTPFQLSCNDGKQINITEALLYFETEISIEQYIGSSVIVIGELKKADKPSPLPVKIDVIRIEALKSAIQ